MSDRRPQTGTDTFARVAFALRTQWMAQHAPPYTATDSEQVGVASSDAVAWDDHSAQTRNLLLDACGSDHRALVDLLLAVGETVRSALIDATAAVTAGGAAERWDTRRAPIVHRLVATRFLQPDVARWLVDSWAFASGVRAQPPESPAMQFVDARDASDAQAASNAGAHALAHALAYAATPSAARTGMASRAATAAGMTGPWRRGAPAVSTGVRGATGNPGGRGRMTPAELARIKRMERVSLAALAGALVFGFVAHGYALWSRPLERERAVPAQASGAMAANSTIGSGALSTASLAVNAATRSERAPAPAPVGGSRPAAAAAIVDTAAAPALPLARAWIGPVAGRYFVTHRKVSVAGGEGCDDVASALAWQQPSIETIEADTGGAAIRLLSRGVSGTLEPDGRFTTGPDSGNTDGVRWTFSMYGRFTADGFTASSRKTTEAIMAWHKSRSCSVVAELTGHRLAR